MDDLAVPADLATALLAAGYRIGGPAGVGSSGPVWSAARAAPDVAGPPDPADRVVVQTVTVPDGDAGARVVARLEALWALEHTHLARVVDVLPLGPRSSAGGGRWAVLLREVPGATVAALLAARGRLSAGEVATLVVPVAGALDAMHHAGLVHGDVSPANVVVRPDGCPVLIDLLGAVRAGWAGDEEATPRHGTPGFTAPERSRRRPARAAGRRAHGPTGGAGTGAPAPSAEGGSRPVADVGRDAVGADAVGAGAVEAGAVAAPPPDAPADVYSLAAVGLAALDLAAAGGRLGQELQAACAPEPLRRPTAGELAGACFAAATPEPIRLPDAGVLARTALTHLALQPRTVSAPGRNRHRARRDRAARRRRALRGASGVVALVVCVLTAFAVARDGRSPGDLTADTGAGSAPAVAPTDTAAGPAPADAPDASTHTAAGPAPADAPDDTAAGLVPADAPDAPTGTAAGPQPAVAPDAPAPTAAVVAVADRPDPVQAAVALTRRRAEVLAAGDPAALDDVSVVGSRAHAADRALLTGLAASGMRLEGVAAVVESAALAEGEGTETDAATPSALLRDPPVEVRVRAGLTAHRRVSSRGVVEVPPEPVRTVVLRLAWTSQGWRVEEVRPG